jgi:hypothetical protein
MNRVSWLFGMLVLAGASGSPSRAEDRPAAQAVRLLEGQAIRLDGRLDEEAWASATPLTRFVQRDPVEGAPASEVTEVRVVYGADALYVGARMSVSDPATIRAPLSRRDDDAQADTLTIYLDTFHDRRTAYSFGVTAAGVRLDGYYSQDEEWAFDASLDPVWSAVIARDGGSAWSVEMRIPLTQVRFRSAPEQVWGLNVRRYVPARNEEDFWAPIAKQQAGWASRFGTLNGLLGIRGGRRLELLPYVAADSTLPTDRDPANPFDRGANLDGRVGGDFKLAVGHDLTLEGTIRPDFGQVEADPAEVNLTAFETYFSEKRPFFVEGAEMLQAPYGPTYFYSRRIGAAPRGPADGDFVDYPRATAILGATELAGRTAGGLSLGMLAAVTGREEAKVVDAGGPVRSETVAPRAGYAVVRAQRLFGSSQSSVGLLATGVHRDLDPVDPLAASQVRNAATVAADCDLRFRGGVWHIVANAGLSRVDGERDAILALQRSSARYFQRPDATHVHPDPNQQSLTGWTGALALEKTAGRHWLGFVDTLAYSPGFEINNAGSQSQVDLVQTWVNLQYRETRPGPVFRSYSVSVQNINRWDFSGERQNATFRAYSGVTWHNFWTSSLQGSYYARAQDPRLTRGGPLMGTPRGWSAALQAGNAASAATRLSLSGVLSGDENGGHAERLTTTLSLRPSPRWRLSLAPYLEQRRDARQYVKTLSDGRPETYGLRYVFAGIDRTTLSAQLRVTAALAPDLTVDLYAEPFAANGLYDGFGELAAARGRALRLYGADQTSIDRTDRQITVTDGADSFGFSDPDFRMRSFRANLVVRWEFRPGSTLYVVWQQDRHESLAPGGLQAGDALRSPGSPGTHVLAVKASFWLPLH